MSKERIKYYGQYDMATGYCLKQVEAFVESFDTRKVFDDINDILELYNVWMLINSGIKLTTWDNAKVKAMQEASVPFIKTVGQFFAELNEERIAEIVKKIDFLYIDDFWILFAKHKVFNHISSKCLSDLLQQRKIQLWQILKHKELVIYYDAALADICRSTDWCAELLMVHFLSERKERYYFPPSLSPLDYGPILERYVNSEDANPNYLRLLEKAQSTKECPISDKLRLAAKNAFQQYWEKHSDRCGGVEFSTGVTFADLPEIVEIKQDGAYDYIVAYDIKWIDENLDYPTLLNNFLYLFEYADFCWRSRIVSVESQISPLERHIGIHGNRDYLMGSVFQRIEMLSSIQMFAYYDVLKKRNIYLEDVIKWYFEEYIAEEFGVRGFIINPPSHETTYLEKCRSLASEMDGILKQFRMFIEDGKINRDLFEMSSEQIVFSSLRSGIQWKYAYSKSDDLRQEQFLLFSDQSRIYYTEKYQSKYSCFCDLISSEKIVLEDFSEYQRDSIIWLKNRGVISTNSNSQIELDEMRVILLKDLYYHSAICLQHYGSLKELVCSLLKSGDLRVSDTLFSEPEQDYLDYKLNRSRFSNGSDLRNKYVHSTYPKDEQIQQRDYIELLKIMIIIIMKVQGELLLIERKQNGKSLSFD